MRAGTITLTVGGQSVPLGAGDAGAFSGDLGHSYANHAAETARFSLAVFEPGVGAGSVSEAHHG